MGEIKVPIAALYGAETQRAVENFPISNLCFSREFIRAMGLVKLAAAHSNDHVNLGQSSNDVIPTAMHVATLERIAKTLIPALAHLHRALRAGRPGSSTVSSRSATHISRARRPSGSTRNSGVTHGRSNSALSASARLATASPNFRWVGWRSEPVSTRTRVFRGRPYAISRS
jgi:fumarate hydratase class II